MFINGQRAPDSRSMVLGKLGNPLGGGRQGLAAWGVAGALAAGYYMYERSGNSGTFSADQASKRNAEILAKQKEKQQQQQQQQ